MGIGTPLNQTVAQQPLVNTGIPADPVSQPQIAQKQISLDDPRQFDIPSGLGGKGGGAASIGGKGGGLGTLPIDGVTPLQQEIADLKKSQKPSVFPAGKGAGYDPEGGMMDGRPSISNYEQGFTNNYPGAGSGGPSNGSGGDLGFGGGGGGGQKKLTLGEVGLTFDPSGGGGGGGGSMQAYAEGGNVSQGLGSLNAGNMGFMHSGKDGISSGEKLREIDILNAYFRQANVPPQQSLKMLQQVIQSGVKFKRDGNTMIGSKRISQDAAQVYFFTVDKPNGFIASVKHLLVGLKHSGVDAVYLNKVDPSIVQALQSAGATPQQSDNPEYKIMAAI